MIGRIQGILVSVHPPRLLVDCHGIGYEVDVPMSTLYQLPEVNQSITLLTHFQVREDVQQLFGFATETEREAFRQLIKISGVGSRVLPANTLVSLNSRLKSFCPTPSPRKGACTAPAIWRDGAKMA